MEPKILAAIMGAITAYIQQEESAQGVYCNKGDDWRLSGQRRQINAAANIRRGIPIRGRGAWRYGGFGKSMITRGWKN